MWSSQQQGRRWLSWLALVAALSLLVVACDGVSVGEPAVEFLDHRTETVFPNGSTGDEDAFVVGLSHIYRVGVTVAFTADASSNEITGVAVVYREAGSGAERSAVATRVENSTSYVFDLPGSDGLELCEEISYAWSVGYDTAEGARGVSFSDWQRVMPERRLAPNGGMDDLACVQLLYEDTDSSSVFERVPISVVRSESDCTYRLEFNNPDNPPDFAVHRVGGNSADPDYEFVSRNCAAPVFTDGNTSDLSHYEQQTVYYWVMLGRQYALDKLWVEPPGWDSGNIDHTPDPIGPNVLIKPEFDHACVETKEPKSGCFRAWPSPEGGRLFLEEGTVEPELVLHEYGHYAAGYVFGYTDALGGMIQIGGGFNPLKCDHRSFQEAVAEMFMSLVLHDARYWHYQPQNPVTAGIPTSKSTYRISGSDTWIRDCTGDANDYINARPLVQAFHQTLWDGVWGTNHERANDAMAAAFSTALAASKGSYRIDDIARYILTYLEEAHETESGRARDIFGAHGFVSIGDPCTSNDDCAGPRTTRCDNTASPKLCIPDDGSGNKGEYCTHDNHCDADQSLWCHQPTDSNGGQCKSWLSDTQP